MLIINNITYTFQKKFFSHTVSNIIIDSLQIKQGERVAILGTNGAGKSTFLKLVLGILKPTSGNILFQGRSTYKHRKKCMQDIGVVWGNRSTLWWDLTPMDNFSAIKKIYKINETQFKKDYNRYVQIFGCSDFLNRPLRSLSLGERMKIEIICALLHRPKLLIFDEPFIGLDIMAKKNIVQSIKQYLEINNCSLLLTSHYPEDIFNLCQRVLLMSHGQIIKDATNFNFLKSYKEQYKILIVLNEPKPLLGLKPLLQKNIIRLNQTEKNKIEITVEKNYQLHLLYKTLVEHNKHIVSLSQAPINISKELGTNLMENE